MSTEATPLTATLFGVIDETMRAIEAHPYRPRQGDYTDGWLDALRALRDDPAIAALDRERAEHAALREALDEAQDVGIYPMNPDPQNLDAPRTPWQDGWNAACIAIAEATEKFWEARAALDEVKG